MRFAQAPDSSAAIALLTQIVEGTPATLPPPVETPLVLYGAGKLGVMAAQMLTRLGRRIECVLDRQARPGQFLLDDIPVVHPDTVTPRPDRRIAICVVTSAFEPIRAALQAAGWTDVIPVYDELERDASLTGMGNGWFAGILEPAEASAIERVLEGWADNHSRAAHLQCLAWRVLREEWTFDDAPVSIDDRYFIPEVLSAWQQGEVLVDGGAWHGDALSAYIDRLGERFRSALALEPDPANAEILSQHIATWPTPLRRRVELLQAALGDRDTDARFAAGHGLAACLHPDGLAQVRVRTLDTLDCSPTLLKLHLEGNELAALKGARDTLRRRRPVVSVTTYHNRDGLYRTPDWLMTHLPDYRFLMRLHGWCATGAVVYAIPIERGSGPTAPTLACPTE